MAADLEMHPQTKQVCDNLPLFLWGLSCAVERNKREVFKWICGFDEDGGTGWQMMNI